MSAILGFAGNIFDAAVANDHYVIYRLTDPTLNIANYEPMYAARWVEPTEIAVAPRVLSSFIFPPAPKPAGLPSPPQPLIPTVIVDDPLDAPPDPGTPVPEPGYSLVMAMLLVILYVRCTRMRAGVIS